MDTRKRTNLAPSTSNAAPVIIDKLPAVPHSVNAKTLHNGCLLTDLQIDFVKKWYEKEESKQSQTPKQTVSNTSSEGPLKTTAQRTRSDSSINAKYQALQLVKQTNLLRKNSETKHVLLHSLSQKNIDSFYNKSEANSYNEIQWRSSRILKDQPKKSKLYSAHNVMIIIDPETKKPRYFAVGLGEKSKSSQNIGSGASGKVKVVQDLDTREWHALKIVDAPKNNRRYNFGDIREEAIKLTKAGVPAFFLKKEKYNHPDSKFPSSRKGFILMEYIDGQPMSKLDHLDRPDIWWLRLIINTLVSLKDIHGNGIIHRDFKEDNVMVSPLLKAKARPIDVGHSNILTGENLNTFSIEIIKTGSTYSHLAPELKNTKHQFETVVFDKKTEVYAAAVTIWNMLKLGEMKFFDSSNLNERSILANAKIKNTKLIAAIMLYLNQHMLNNEPAKRPSMQEAIDHFNTLLENYINENPEALTKKIGMLDIGEFQKLSEKNKKKMIENLKSFDVVWTIDQYKKQDKNNNYITFRQELCAAGVMLSDKIFSSNGIMKLDEFVAQIPVCGNSENHPFTYVTMNKETKKAIMQQHTVKVYLLEKEKRSLTNNVGQLFTSTPVRFSLPSRHSLQRQLSEKSDTSTDEEQLSLTPEMMKRGSKNNLR